MNRREEMTTSSTHSCFQFFFLENLSKELDFFSLVLVLNLLPGHTFHTLAHLNLIPEKLFQRWPNQPDFFPQCTFCDASYQGADKFSPCTQNKTLLFLNGCWYQFILSWELQWQNIHRVPRSVYLPWPSQGIPLLDFIILFPIIKCFAEWKSLSTVATDAAKVNLRCLITVSSWQPGK